MNESLVIPDGHKYALLALHVDHLILHPNIAEPMADGFHASLELPFDVPKHWQEWLGSLRTQEVTNANLFLTLSRESDSPGSLDQENLALTKDLERFYFSLLMSVPYIGHPKATMMTGARQGGRVDVRRLETIEAVYCPAGCDGNVLNGACISSALAVAEGIGELQGPGEHSRVWRATNAFYTGLKASQPGDRIHQLVRCVEGFVIPEIGKTRKQVISRARLFVSPHQDDLIGQLFDIRSSVEHLHGPLVAITESNLKAKNLVLARRAYEIESMARHCLATLFLRQQLWPSFRNEPSLSAFWSLEEAERRDLWGDPLDWDTVSSTFDSERVSIQVDP